MAVPKKKVSPSRRDMRRSHHALSIPAVVEDKQTRTVPAARTTSTSRPACTAAARCWCAKAEADNAGE